MALPDVQCLLLAAWNAAWNCHNGALKPAAPYAARRPGTMASYNKRAARSPGTVQLGKQLRGRSAGPPHAPWRRGRPPCWHLPSCRWHPHTPAAPNSMRHCSSASGSCSSALPPANHDAKRCMLPTPAQCRPHPPAACRRCRCAAAACQCPPGPPHLLPALQVNLDQPQLLDCLVHGRLQAGG